MPQAVRRRGESSFELPDRHDGRIRIDEDGARPWRRWIRPRGHDRESLYTSAIVVGEILTGLRRLPSGERKARLLEQFSFLRTSLSGRVLPIREQTAEHWAEIRASAQARGATVPAIDALIAATAMEHDLTVVTRNSRDFVAAGAKVLNPWT